MYKIELKNNMGFFETNSNNVGQIDFDIVENIYYFDEQNKQSINVTNFYVDLHKYNRNLDKIVPINTPIKITLPRGKYEIQYNNEQIQTFEILSDIEIKELIFKNEGYYTITTLPPTPCHSITIKVFEINEINKSDLIEIK